MAYIGGGRRPGERTSSRKPIIQEFVPSSAWTEDPNGHYLLVDLPDFQKDQVRLQVDTSSGNVMVSGERLTNDKSKIILFEQSFKLPPNPDIDKITGKFDSEILYVTVPKLVQVEEQQEVPKKETENSSNITKEIKDESSPHHQQNDENVNSDHPQVHGKEEHHDDNAKLKIHEQERQSEKKQMDCCQVDGFSKEEVEKWAKETSQVGWAIKILKRNKGVVLTAMIALCLGYYVCRKFGAAPTHEAATFQ